MNLYYELLNKPVFTLEDINQYYNNIEAARTAVRRLIAQELIVRIRKNMYTCISGETGCPVANKYQIGSAVSQTAYISHHTAMEYYGVCDQVYYDVYVSSETPFKEFEFDGYTYCYVASKCKLGIENVHYSGGVRITDKERTTLDSIKDMDKISGIEEVLANIDGFTSLNEEMAQNLIEIQRSMTTSSTAIFVPFTTQELFQTGKEALYYGLNALSNNLIMVDRKKLKNPNGLILGTPGSGKSFSAKREIANAFLVTDDDVIVCDPEAEYTALVQKFEGQVIKISPSSTQYINPMDINANYSEEDNPIALKADFILSLCELIVGGKEGLQPVEKTVIDRCVHQIYQTYFENPVPENMPVLQDLYEALLRQDEKEAHHVATALEIYVTGSLNLFNHRTNVDINNRLVCYDIKELGKQLKKIGMLVVQDQVWGRVTANRNAGKATRYYMDEFHLLLNEEQTAAYSVEIWKRFRKWGGIPTGITQNVKDLLSSREVTNIFENSDFIYMLNQAAGDRQILADQLNISPHQLSYVTHSGEGEGLLFYGNVILPFVDRFPTDLELYRIMTTKLTEVQEAKEA